MKNTLLIVIGLFFCIGFSEAQTNITDSILFQGYYRTFITHIPPNYTGSDSVPLVFVLHGGGGTANGMISFSEFDLVSDTVGFIVVFPQGAVPASSGGFTWADGRGTPADTAGIDDVSFISALIDHLNNYYEINNSKVYACGMSNGGFMSQRLAVELNNKIAAVASVGSTIDLSQVSTYQPALPVPVMLINGVDDLFVPFYGGPVNGSQGYAISSFDLLDFWFQKNNCTGQIDSIQLPDIVTTESSTITKYYNHNCDCNSHIVLYKVNGGGHTWPGVPNFLYELIAGQTNEDIHASVEIWEFFNNFENCETTNAFEINYDNTIPYKIFPNPTNEFFIIESFNEKMNELKLIDINGRTIIEKTKFQSNVSINLSNVENGIYFLILYGGKNVHTTKIVKNK
jgi:polyhydroxybutyrate depolymerase